MNIRKKTDKEVFDNICEQLETRGELCNREAAFSTMVKMLRKLFTSYCGLEEENTKLKKKVELYEKNAVALFRINQPTVPQEYVVDFLNDENLDERIAEANKGTKYFKNPPIQSIKPTFKKPCEHIVVKDGITYSECADYEEAIRFAKRFEDCTIWELEWDVYKGDWKLTRGEYYHNGKFCDKSNHDYLHYGTLDGFLTKE